MENSIILEESLEISALAACRAEWQTKLVSAAPEIDVFVDKLTRIDTAAVQMLLALKNDATNLGKTFRIRGDSSALRNQAEILGLSALMTSAVESTV